MGKVINATDAFCKRIGEGVVCEVLVRDDISGQIENATILTPKHRFHLED